MLSAFILFCLFIWFAPVSAAQAQTVRERLVFDLTWTGIKVGTATLEMIDDGGSARIISTARSADWVSAFYKVEDRVESVLAETDFPASLGMPRTYRLKIREGRHRRDKEVVFDRDAMKAHFINHLKGEKTECEIHKTTFDPLSSFFYVRTLPMKVGSPLFVDVFDSKKRASVEVQVLRKERIKTELGEFDTVVIKPLLKTEGIFNRAGDMYIWLTDDARHLPVMMKTKVALGSVTATLASGGF